MNRDQERLVQFIRDLSQYLGCMADDIDQKGLKRINRWQFERIQELTQRINTTAFHMLLGDAPIISRNLRFIEEIFDELHTDASKANPSDNRYSDLKKWQVERKLEWLEDMLGRPTEEPGDGHNSSES